VKNTYKIVFEKPEGKRALRGPKHRWEDNIKINLKKIGCELDSPGSQ
jgi:hypothetical protein